MKRQENQDSVGSLRSFVIVVPKQSHDKAIFENIGGMDFIHFVVVRIITIIAYVLNNKPLFYEGRA